MITKKKGFQSSTIRGEHKEVEMVFEEMSIEEFETLHPEFSYGRKRVKNRKVTK